MAAPGYTQWLDTKDNYTDLIVYTDLICLATMTWC